jgi:tight adherence protein B
VRSVAVVLAGLAAAFAAGRRPNLLRARLGPRPDSVSVREWLASAAGVGHRGKPSPHGCRSRRLAGVVIAAGSMSGLLIGGPVLAALAAAVSALVVASRVRMVAARRGREYESTVAEACIALAADLRSGLHPRQALQVAAAEWPSLFGQAAGRADVGGDVAPALRAVAGASGSAMSAVAAGWQVSERTGAALAVVLTAVADALRADAAARREADAQLSTVRVTARLLAILPVGSLVLLSGGNLAVVRFLVDSPVGLACLGGALVLVAAGLWWVDRLVRSATKPSW